MGRKKTIMTAGDFWQNGGSPADRALKRFADFLEENYADLPRARARWVTVAKDMHLVNKIDLRTMQPEAVLAAVNKEMEKHASRSGNSGGWRRLGLRDESSRGV